METNTETNKDQPTGVTANMLLAAVCATASMTLIGVIILTLFGGSAAVATTNYLLTFMGTVITGLIALLVTKLNAMHRQFNQRMDEYLEIAKRQSHAEGVAVEREVAAKRAADLAVTEKANAKALAVETATTAVNLALHEQEKTKQAADESEQRAADAATAAAKVAADLAMVICDRTRDAATASAQRAEDTATSTALIAADLAAAAEEAAAKRVPSAAAPIDGA